MNRISIVAIDVESCSVSSKYPTYFDFIIGISVHTTASLNPSSLCQGRHFVVERLTYEDEESVLTEFLSFLQENTGAILTAYNLVGFDQQILLSRLKEHYPLGFRFLDILPEFSLYDTMIAYKAYVQSPVSCKMIQALRELAQAGYQCFIFDHKSARSGKEVLSLWARENARISKEFTLYIAEDSYNHLRLAQVLLSLNANKGFWSAKVTERLRESK